MAGVIEARIGFSGGRSGGGSGSNEGVGDAERDCEEEDEGELGEVRVAWVSDMHAMLLANVVSEFCRGVLRAPTHASRRSR